MTLGRAAEHQFILSRTLKMSVCERGYSKIRFFEFPSHLRMLSNDRRCLAVDHAFPEYLAVTHCKQAKPPWISRRIHSWVSERNDDADDTFYYYANGCSAVYLKKGMELEGRNRVDVHMKLLQLEFGDQYIQKIPRLSACGLDYLSALEIKRHATPCAADKKVVNSSCLSRLNLNLKHGTLSRRALARKYNFTTLIYKFENSGGDPTKWKTEIQRVVPYYKDKFWRLVNGSYRVVNFSRDTRCYL